MILEKTRKNVVFGTDDLARGCLFVGSNWVKADFYAECSCNGNHELNNVMQKPRKNALSFCSWLPREEPVAICRLISIRFRKKRQPRASGVKIKTTFFRRCRDLAVETNISPKSTSCSRQSSILTITFWTDRFQLRQFHQTLM